MTERRGVDTGERFEAACNNLIDLELNALNGRDIHQIASQDTTKQFSSPIQRAPHSTELPSSKGNKLYLHISVCYSVKESALVNSLNQKHQPSRR